VYADILILSALLKRPMHGYEIKKEYDDLLAGLVTLHHNQLYPALRRFEEMGAVRRDVVEQQGKPDRLIYQLTEDGFQLLREMLREFPLSIALNDMEFMVRFALFGFLEPDDRLTILKTRRKALTMRYEKGARVTQTLDIPVREKVQPYVDQLRELNTKKMSDELGWLEAMIEREQNASSL